MQKYPEKIIIAPLLTEKSNASKTDQNKYTFKVLKQANKKEILAAIAHLYAVTPLSCRVINVSGKKKRQGKFVGSTSSYKKAIVSLKQNDSIAILEGV